MRPAASILRNSNPIDTRIRNLGAWHTHLATQLRHQIEVTGDPELKDLLRELLGYPSGQEACHEWQGGPAMPMIIETRLGLLSFIGATTVFGTPADVTLEEIALEVMHPADAFTDEAVPQAA